MFNYLTGISGVYQIKREEATHTLVLLEDGRIVIDGNFAQSVIYRQGVGTTSLQSVNSCFTLHVISNHIQFNLQVQINVLISLE